MCQGLVPKLWKEGNITALFKKGDKTEPGASYADVFYVVLCQKLS
jgi:hypothetical protein